MITEQDIDRVVAHHLAEDGERLPECPVCEAAHLTSLDATRCCQPHLTEADARELLEIIGFLDDFEENITDAEQRRISRRLDVEA